MPSTFAEFVAYDHLLAHEDDAETRRVLLAARAEGAFATIYRQTVLARYEQRAYGMRAGAQTLTPERLGAIWIEENRRYYGDSVALPEGYAYGWSYIPHFISTRFYTYAYVFAKLVALALYARWRAEGEAFVPGYMEFLAAGASASPRRAAGPAGRRSGQRRGLELGLRGAGADGGGRRIRGRRGKPDHPKAVGLSIGSLLNC